MPDSGSGQDSTRGAREPGHSILFVLIVLFGLVSVFGTPFRYEHRNSGLYLLGVLRAADPQLFPNDPIVDSLARYRSAFYDLLSYGFRASGAPPQRVEPVIRVLYVVSKLLLVLALFLVARALTPDLWVFVVLALYGAFPEASPVGGPPLIEPKLTHDELAQILVLFALACLWRQRNGLFWAILCVAVFVHPLVAFHFVLAAAPVVLLRTRFAKTHLAGVALFGLCAVLYVHFFAPPPMTSEEARLFLLAKGDKPHVSLFAQSATEWLRMAGLVLLCWLAQRNLARSDSKSGLLLGFILSGTASGLCLSTVATFGHWARLAQFQPMRIFIWVTFFCYVLLALLAVRALRESRPVAGILLAIPMLTAMGSLWALLFLFLGLAYFLLLELGPAAMQRLPSPDTLTRAALALAVAGIFVAWALGRRQPFPSFRDPVTLAPALLVGSFASISVLASRRRWIAAGLLVVTSAVGATIVSHRARSNPDWDAVRRWAERNTPKAARFLTPPKAHDFRTLSLRTTVSERTSTIAWVDPRLNEENREFAHTVERGLHGKVWDLAYLDGLARRAGAAYILVKGPYTPSAAPLFRSGAYTVFRTTEP